MTHIVTADRLNQATWVDRGVNSYQDYVTYKQGDEVELSEEDAKRYTEANAVVEKGSDEEKVWQFQQRRKLAAAQGITLPEMNQADLEDLRAAESEGGVGPASVEGMQVEDASALRPEPGDEGYDEWVDATQSEAAEDGENNDDARNADQTGNTTPGGSYEDLDYPTLQQTAKARGLNAGGSADDLRTRLREQDAEQQD